MGLLSERKREGRAGERTRSFLFILLSVCFFTRNFFNFPTTDYCGTCGYFSGRGRLLFSLKKKPPGDGW